MDAIGRNCWAIAEDHIPAKSSFNDRALVSHETACVLNAGGSDAHAALTILPIASRPGPTALLSARRTLHLRFNDLEEPLPVPRDRFFILVRI